MMAFEMLYECYKVEFEILGLFAKGLHVYNNNL